MIDTLIRCVRAEYGAEGFIPLHAPLFGGNEAAYVAQTVASTMVSSVGAFVDRFEGDMAALTGAGRAVAVMNGTAALHMALMLAGVGANDLVITQALTFVATCNAIIQTGAEPVFCDVDRTTLGLSPEAVADWLHTHAERTETGPRRRSDGRKIAACLPMHSFGHPVRLAELMAVCDDWGLVLVEDAAESLGSTYNGGHTGTFGRLGTQSFNGNKILTTGGGGMILSDTTLGARAKHLTTTAKKPHAWDYVHDAVGYNYRMPNLNAALGVAQLERLPAFLAAKRGLAARYRSALSGVVEVVVEPADCQSNYWLNAVICDNRAARDAVLTQTNAKGVMTRPIWALMTRLPMYSACAHGPLPMSEWLEDRVVNIPSGVTAGMLT